jgi:hypothetical protein
MGILTMIYQTNGAKCLNKRPLAADEGVGHGCKPVLISALGLLGCVTLMHGYSHAL